MKGLRKLLVATLVIFAVATVIIWCLATEAQSVTGSKFTVVFSFVQPNVPEPDTRIYVLVDADNEGEASIKAYKHLAEKLTINATEKLKFVESQRKQ